MISIHGQSYSLSMALYSEFILEGSQGLEQALLACKQRIRLPDTLLDLLMLKDLIIDMAVEQIKFLNQHETSFGRAAVVTDGIWIKLGARLPGLLTSQRLKYFNDAAGAQAWLPESDPK